MFNAWIQFGFQPVMPKKKEEEKMMTSIFPWFNEKQIAQLERDTANIADPMEKIKMQDSIYRQVAPMIKEKEAKEARMKAKNQFFYANFDEKDLQRSKLNQVQLKIEDLADMVKERVGIPATAKTEEVMNLFSQELQQRGIEPQILQDYVDWKSEELLYLTELKARPVAPVKEEKSVFENIVWWAAESTSWVAEFVWTSLAKWIWRISKKLWADETKVNQLVDSYIKSWDTLWWEDIGDEDSLVYQWAKMLFDIAQVAAPWWLARWAAKWTQVAWKWAKAVEWLWKINKNWAKLADDIAIWWENVLLKAWMKPKAAEKAAQLTSKVLSRAWEWALDMVMFDIIAEWELPNLKEVWLWAAIGGALPIAWAWLSAARRWIAKVAPKLELSWLLNPAKLTSVKEKLIEEWTEAMWKWKSSDVGKWMIERNIKWDKTGIVEQLIKHSDESKGIVDWLLWSSTTKHNIPAAKTALNNLYKDIKNIPWLEWKADDIANLLKKDTYTLSELNEIKRELDDIYNLYTRAGGESAGLKSQWLRNIRAEIRKYIEKQATDEWLGNIKMLNNETSISRTLADAINKKDSADLSREILSIFAKWTVWGMAWTQVWPFKWDGWLPKIWNFIVWAIVGKYLLSTKSKTYVANSLRKLSWFEKKELNRFIQSKGKEALSAKTLNKIDEIREWAKTLSTKKTNNVDNMAGGDDIMKQQKPQSESIPQLKATVKAPEEIFHETSQINVDKIMKEWFKVWKELNVAEKRWAIYFGGKWVNEWMYSRTKGWEAFAWQKPWKIKIDTSDLNLLDMNIKENYIKYNDYVVRWELDKLPKWYDWTISRLKDGRIYEVALKKDVANRKLKQANKWLKPKK